MIGVAGCGRMGLPMLQALRDAGATAYGYDTAPKAPDWVTDDAATFARDLETLLIVVRDKAQCDDVLFGAQNFVTRAPSLRRVLICSTLSPKYVTALRDRIASEITLIDAPMSGAESGAMNRTLTFMLGGAKSDIDDAMPLLGAMGQKFFRMGGYGAGMQAKVLNNLLAASHTAMTRLVLDWADASGLSQDALLNVINASSGQNWLSSGMDEIEFARDGYRPDNSIGILVKDVAAALDAAPEDSETTLPQTVMTVLRNLRPLPLQS